MAGSDKATNIESSGLKHQEITTDFIKFLDLEMDQTYLSSLTSEEKNLLLLDLQMVTEGIKKVMLTMKR